MDDRYSPQIPEKPLAYSRSGSDSTTMQALLSSLNIDEEPYIEQQPSRTSYSGPERLQTGYDRRFGTPPEVAGDYTRAQPAVTRPPSAMLPGSKFGSQAIRSTESLDSDQDMDHRPSVNGSLPSSGILLPMSQNQSHPQATGGGMKRPIRKPVVIEAPRRTYFSPDDLDELVAKSPNVPPSPLPLNVATQQHRRTSPPQPFSALPRPAKIPSEYSDSGMRYNPYATQSGHGYQYMTHQAPSPASLGYVPPERRALYDEYSVSYTPVAVPDHRRFPFHDRTYTPYEESAEGAQASPRFAAPEHISQIRVPSPPTRRDSVPFTDASGYSRPATAFDQHPDLAPTMRSYGSPQPEMANFAPPSRHNSMPLRSMSSLSDHSQRSPDRQYRHPISELESLYGGRIPSPDRSTQFPDYDTIVEDDTDDSPMVPATTQIRRGRQKGEVVVESDLPPMPPLFANQEERESVSRQALPPLSIPSQSTPPLSPARSPTAVPQFFARKPKVSSKEADILQSIKVLPIKPIKCPPLCVEERFHPFPFVKTNKFKIKVRIDQTPFVAGGEIFGHIDIISDEGFRAQFGTTQVLVGEIGVEVIGFEEIQNSDSGHQPRSFTFLYGRKILQKLAETHPLRAEEEHFLTSAVLNDPPPDQDGYRAAAKGTNSFPFAFPLPVDAPSSADMHVAKIKYLVTGYATVKLQGSQEVIASSTAVRVVEAWDVGNPVYEDMIEATQGRDIANYQEIAAVAKIPKSLYIEGQTISGSIRVANHSSKKIRDVKFFLINKITFFGDKRAPTKDLNPSEDVSIEQTVVSLSEPHQIMKGEEESWIFNLQIPVDRCLSIRNSALFEVTPIVLVKISTGPLQKSTRLYISQLSIANPGSMVDGLERLAPSSSLLKWSNLPSLYRYQVVVGRQPQQVQKGVLEVTELMTYSNAHERVAILNDKT